MLDSGGLSALIGPSQRARATLRWIVERGGAVIIPSPVLVETTTGDGGRDAEINRVLSILQRELGAIRAPDEKVARIAGRLRHRASTDDGVDALVAAAAVAMGTRVVLLTSDPTDLERLLSGESDVAVRSV